MLLQFRRRIGTNASCSVTWVWWTLPFMATLAQKIQCETHVRQMLEREGMPMPDEVEYGFGCIRLFFNEPKVMLVVDIDDYSEVDEAIARRAASGEPAPEPTQPAPRERDGRERDGREHDGRGPPFSMFPYPGPGQRN